MKPRDIHSEKPIHPIYLDRVGIDGIMLNTRVKIGMLYAAPIKLGVYIDLPSATRGAHLSRISEALAHINDREYSSLRSLATHLCTLVLEENRYSRRCYLKLEAKIPRYPKPPLDIIYNISLAKEEGISYESLDISTIGQTSCPCAQETFRFYEEIVDKPVPTHMQRARATLRLSRDQGLPELDIDRLIGIVESSFSAEVRDLLKRYDEYLLIKRSLQRPLFAEDVVRSIIASTLKYLRENGYKGVRVSAEVESYDSIHSFNVVAIVEALS